MYTLSVEIMESSIELTFVNCSKPPGQNSSADHSSVVFTGGSKMLRSPWRQIFEQKNENADCEIFWSFLIILTYNVCENELVIVIILYRAVFMVRCAFAVNALHDHKQKNVDQMYRWTHRKNRISISFDYFTRKLAHMDCWALHIFQLTVSQSMRQAQHKLTIQHTGDGHCMNVYIILYIVYTLVQSYCDAWQQLTILLLYFTNKAI